MNKKLKFVFISFFFCFSLNHLSLALQSEDFGEDPPEDVVLIQEQSIDFTQNGVLTFKIEVKEGFFAYLDKFELHIEPLTISKLRLDPIVSFYDKTFKKDKKGVRNLTQLKAKYLGSKNFAEGEVLNIELAYQACTPEYCLFPTQTTHELRLTKDMAQMLSESHKPDWLKGGTLYALLLIFFTGLLTSLTPCVYPLIPITLAVLGREKADTKLKGFTKSFVYVLGMAIMYSGLGIFAATSGFMFGSLLSNFYFISFLSFVLFLAALSMFDLFEIKAPAFLNKLGGGAQKKTYIGIFLSGIFSGLVVGPCVGPVLVGILSYVSTSGDIFKGFAFLFVFALGLGALIILLGTFSGLIEKLPRSGAWMIWVKKFLGFVFIFMIAYFIKPLVDVKMLFLIMSLVLSVFSFFILLKDKKTKEAGLLEKAVYKSILIFSLFIALICILVGQERFERLVGYSSSTFINTQWEVFSEEKLVQAKERKEIVVLDFYADWCAACKELKHITFADKRVLNYEKKIKWLYFDSTKTSKELDFYKEKYKILGLPTIIIYDSKGLQREDLTLTGFEGPEKFLERLRQLE